MCRSDGTVKLRIAGADCAWLRDIATVLAMVQADIPRIGASGNVAIVTATKVEKIRSL